MPSSKNNYPLFNCLIILSSNTSFLNTGCCLQQLTDFYLLYQKKSAVTSNLWAKRFLQQCWTQKRELKTSVINNKSSRAKWPFLQKCAALPKAVFKHKYRTGSWRVPFKIGNKWPPAEWHSYTLTAVFARGDFDRKFQVRITILTRQKTTRAM